MLDINIIKNQNKEIEGVIGTIIKYSKISGNLDEDLFNEQLYLYYKSKERHLASKSKFNSYLTVVLKNNRSNYLRDNNNEEEILVDTTDLIDFEYSQDIENDYMKNKLISIIKEELNKLDSKAQTVIKEKIFNCLTFREIGDILDISKQAANTLYNRKIKLLRRKVKSQWN